MGIGRYQALFCSWEDEHMRRRIASSLSWAGHWANLGYLCEEGVLWQAFSDFFSSGPCGLGLAVLFFYPLLLVLHIFLVLDFFSFGRHAQYRVTMLLSNPCSGSNSSIQAMLWIEAAWRRRRNEKKLVYYPLNRPLWPLGNFLYHSFLLTVFARVQASGTGVLRWHGPCAPGGLSYRDERITRKWGRQSRVL